MMVPAVCSGCGVPIRGTPVWVVLGVGPAGSLMFGSMDCLLQWYLRTINMPLDDRTLVERVLAKHRERENT